MFYALSASIGFMRLILLAIMKLDDSAINMANSSIGTRLNGLNEKLKLAERVLPIFKLASKETRTSCIEAKTKEIKH